MIDFLRTVAQGLVHEAQTVPLNLILIIPVVWLSWDILFPKALLTPGAPIPSSYEEAYAWRPKNHPSTILWQRYTPKTLSLYDGRKNERILLAISGVVYDVTAGKNFYGPDGPYGNFAGRDASRGMAKQSFELDMLTPIEAALDPLKDLTTAEIDNMNNWSEHFRNKYLLCGELVENDAL